MKTDESGSAFPFQANDVSNLHMQTSGLTKRELFAAMAMQGMLSAGDGETLTFQRVAAAAVGQADALLEALE